MTLVPNETEQALNRQHDVYAAAREEYRKKIAEQAAEIERLRAALREIESLDDEPKCCGRGIGDYLSPPECCGDPERGIDRAQSIARAALEGRT